MRPFRLTLTGLAAIAAIVALAACGSSSSGGNGTSPGSTSGTNSGAAPTVTGLANTKPNAATQKMGGTLNMISAEGWEHLDPGASYFQIDYVAVYATQSPLYMFNPYTDVETPLLAKGPPQISSDGKTVTVHLKP